MEKMNDKEKDRIYNEFLQILHDPNYGEKKRLEFINQNETHRPELEHLAETWDHLEAIDTPEPSAQMDIGFYKMLNENQAQQKHVPVRNPNDSIAGRIAKVIKLNFTPRRMSIAAAIAGGLLVGRYIFPSNNSPMSQQVAINKQLQFQDNTMEVSYNPDWTVSERLAQVNKSKKIIDPTDKVLEALYMALINDPNTNVRLSAIETLTNFVSNPVAREYLIKSIPFQHSAIVQMELAELMIELEENRSASEWKTLFDSNQVEADTKIQLQKKLTEII